MSYISNLNSLLSSYSSTSVSPRKNRYKISQVKFKPKDLGESQTQKPNIEQNVAKTQQAKSLVRVSTGPKYNSNVASALLMAQEQLSQLNSIKENQSEITLDLNKNKKAQGQDHDQEPDQTQAQAQGDLFDNDKDQDNAESITSYKDVEKKIHSSLGLNNFSFAKSSVSYAHSAYNNTTNNNMPETSNINPDVASHYNNFQFKNPVGTSNEYPFPDSPLGARTQSYVAGLYTQTGNFLTANSQGRSNPINNNYMNASKL